MLPLVGSQVAFTIHPFTNCEVLDCHVNTEANPYSPVESESANEPHAERHRWLPTEIVVLYGLAFFYGVSQVFRYSSGTLDLLGGILFAFVLTAWAVADSRRRGNPMVSIVRVLYLLFCPLSTFLYLVGTRGFWGVGWFLLNGVFLYASIAVGLLVMFYLLYFTGHWELMDQAFFEE